ncbi:MAG: cytochrome ubiquinol oxidase subunit I, partial [Muribaculaceae bacterium]|nr:cytochrome ubiquinol oxidase subunit I [Muribaculaceae bacterium]
AKVQPMKLAAMEGLYDGKVGQELVGFGFVNTDKRPGDSLPAIKAEISIPYGLSVLANHDPHSFVPGINDLIEGVSLTPQGDTVNTVSYAERIRMGRTAREALAEYGQARQAGDEAAAAAALKTVRENYRYFGYGYFDNPEDAVPPVAMTFYSFRVMVVTGGYLLLLFIALVFISYRKTSLLERSWLHWLCIISIPLVWICSQAGWVLAEVGRQPWTIQDLLPVQAAVSAIPADNVVLTFCLFAVLFTMLLAAEISIMLRYISRKSKTDIMA